MEKKIGKVMKSNEKWKQFVSELFVEIDSTFYSKWLVSKFLLKKSRKYH